MLARLQNSLGSIAKKLLQGNADLRARLKKRAVGLFPEALPDEGIQILWKRDVLHFTHQFFGIVGIDIEVHKTGYCRIFNRLAADVNEDGSRQRPVGTVIDCSGSGKQSIFGASLIGVVDGNELQLVLILLIVGESEEP